MQFSPGKKIRKEKVDSFTLVDSIAVDEFYKKFFRLSQNAYHATGKKLRAEMRKSMGIPSLGITDNSR